ncbi:MAG: transglycosylase SLT domain-containing protein [Gemmatimonadota bacterium]
MPVGVLAFCALAVAWSLGAGWADAHPRAAGGAADGARVGSGDIVAADTDADAGAAPEPGILVDRAERAERKWRAVAVYYDRHVAPIERVLRRYGGEPGLARRIAVALVRHANAVGLEPRLLLAVLLVENPAIDPTARSSVGAIGLMQVMPHHRGNWAPCAPDLEDVEANICHGARIFAHYFHETGGDVERALLRYNGCVRGTNTPDCHRYPYHVYARAGRASLLAWLRPTPARAASP